MSTLNFPASVLGPSSVDWRLRSNTQTFRSPLDGSVQTLEMPGAVWAASLSWDALPAAQWRVMQAWLAQLRGAAGRFFYGPPHAAARQATGVIGTPLINGAGQTGVVLACDGFGASQAVFLAGDYIAYNTAAGRSLHLVTANATSNGSGQASLQIEPPIRVSPADNAALIHAAPSCVMRLVDDEIGGLSIRPAGIGSLSLEIVEAYQ
jgi:hypothetical protein